METGDICGRKYPLVKGWVLGHCMTKCNKKFFKEKIESHKVLVFAKGSVIQKCLEKSGL